MGFKTFYQRKISSHENQTSNLRFIQLCFSSCLVFTVSTVDTMADLRYNLGDYKTRKMQTISFNLRCNIKGHTTILNFIMILHLIIKSVLLIKLCAIIDTHVVHTSETMLWLQMAMNFHLWLWQSEKMGNRI